MPEEEIRPQPTDEEPATRAGFSARVAIAMVVVALFAGVLAAKYLAPDRPSAGGAGDAAASVTSVRNDAAADYEAALRTGKPVYVLFHSLS